jgi:hypothetical protein
MSKNPANPADKTFVVVENGQRVTGPLESRDAAETEARQRNQIAESGSHTVPENRKAKVKMNLCG